MGGWGVVVEGVSLLRAHGLSGEIGVKQPGFLALVGRGQRDSRTGRFLGFLWRVGACLFRPTLFSSLMTWLGEPWR